MNKKETRTGKDFGEMKSQKGGNGKGKINVKQ